MGFDPGDYAGTRRVTKGYRRQCGAGRTTATVETRANKYFRITANHRIPFISLLQSITQIQEVTLAFVPKAIGVAVVLLIAGHWMISEMVTFTNELFARIPSLLGGGG